MTLLQGGNVSIDGVATRSDLRFEGGVIAEVGDLRPLAGEAVIDIAGCTAIPGLIDAHTHLTHYDTVDSDSPVRAAFRSASRARAALRAGITTARDTGSAGNLNIALRDAVRDGLVAGPRMLSSGASLSMTGGHVVRRARIADGVDAVRAAVREQIGLGADFVKLNVSGGVSRGESVDHVQFTAAEIRVAVEEASAAGTYVAVHAHPPAAIKRAVIAGARAVEHGSLIDAESIDVMVDHGAFLTPTFAIYDIIASSDGDPETVAATKALLERKLECFALVLASDVDWAIGSDCGSLSPVSSIATELEVLVDRFGLSASEVLRRATSGNARLLALDDVGTLDVGARADIAVVGGDPWADISAVRDVRMTIAGGNVFDWSSEAPAVE